MSGLSNRPIPNPHALLTPKSGIKKSPFEIAAKRLEIDENINRARLIRHFLAFNLCHKQSYSMSERRSDTSSMITIVAITMLIHHGYRLRQPEYVWLNIMLVYLHVHSVVGDVVMSNAMSSG